MMNCQLIRKHLSAYIDGELEATPLIEFEQHLEQCAGCKDELIFNQLLKSSIRQKLAGSKAPDALRLRISRSLNRDSKTGQLRSDSYIGKSAFGVFAIAAAVLLAIGSSINSDSPNLNQASLSSSALLALSDIVNSHEDQLPTEIETEIPSQAATWFRGKLGFRVQSVEFNQPQVRLKGARISYVGNSRAAEMVYHVGDSRITMIAFRPQNDLSIWGGRRTQIGKRVLTYQTVRGYTVPIIQHNGITYAFTGDLDQQKMLRLVASAQLP